MLKRQAKGGTSIYEGIRMLSYSHHKRIAQESHVNFNGTQPIKRQKSGFCSTQQTDLQVRTSLLCTRCSSSLRQVKASKAKSTGKAKWGERQAKVHDSQIRRRNHLYASADSSYSEIT